MIQLMKRIGDCRFEENRLASALRLFVCAGVAFGFAAGAAAAASDEKEQTFTLREVSVFDQGADNFIRGQFGPCREKPFTEVKAYPRFKSAKPLYGSVSFGGIAEGADAKRTFYCAFDESEGTGKGYDRLYFDLNLDLDLRNDPVLKPQSRPPEAARLKYSNIKQQVLFDFLSLDFASGPAGTRAVQIMPRLYISKFGEEEYTQVNFVRTRLYKGDIKVGGKEYQALLGTDHAILGRLDQPNTALTLLPKASQERVYWWGGDRLSAIQKIEGRFFTFSANPAGDQLTVHPYQGELGTFEVGPGERKVETLTMSGSLKGKDRAVPVGGEVVEGSPKAERRCQLPVGDYTPSYISVRIGRLEVDISENYHSDGKRQNRGDRPYVYGIAIRPDKPYVLDFSNPPAVLFASPEKGQRIKAGETLEVYGVLVDPKLDVMIRGLDDTSRKQTKDAEGKALGYERNLSLDPKVIITRANGEKVVEGVMPFG